MLPKSCILLNLLLTPLQLTEFDAQFNALKAMVENAVAFFYPNNHSTIALAPQLLDGLLAQS
jgi:hypothetical protein